MTADEVQLLPGKKMARSGGITIDDGEVAGKKCSGDGGRGWVRLVDLCERNRFG